MRRALVVVLCIIASALPAAGFAAPRECRNRDLDVSLRLDQKRYRAGERVRMKMTVKNAGARCTMVWSDGQVADFYVFDADKKVWSADACHAFTQAIVREDWPAGHQETYRERWNKREGGRGCPGRGEQVAPGRYRAQGHFKGAGEPRTDKVPFRIVP